MRQLPLFAPVASFAQSDKETPQDTSIERQFDFWIGDWDLNWEGGSGQNRVTAEFGGFVIRENFSADPDTSASTPLKGMSVSVYSSAKNQWLQTWVDNTGSYLDFEGEFSDGKMTLVREFVGKKGKNVRQRMVFYNIAADSLDWNWEVSVEGAEWKPLWKIHYKRKK